MQPIRLDNGSGLQNFLWTVWTLSIIACVWLQWHADAHAHHALDLVALLVHCGVLGVIGLVVVTWIEMRLEPWRWLA